MKAYQCDLCKKFYKLSDLEKNNRTFNIHITDKFLQYYNNAELDICNECYEKNQQNNKSIGEIKQTKQSKGMRLW